MDRIAVLIPCYNEAVTIEKVVKDFKQTLPEAVIYVYDNNSTDKTAENAKKAGAVVRHEFQQGKGNVVRRMFQEIEAQCYIMVDGDDTYPADASVEMVEKVLKHQADMVIGDRLSSTYFERNNRPFHNLGNRFMKSAINFLFHSNLSDIMTGYRAFSYRFVKTFPVLSQNFEIETEMSIHALDKNLQIESVAIVYQNRPEGSQSKLNTVRDGIQVVRKMIQLFCIYRPVAFFGTIGMCLMSLAAIMMIPICITFSKTGLVPRFPTLIVSGFMGIAGLESLFLGVLLEYMGQKNRQDFEMELHHCVKDRCQGEKAGYEYMQNM